MGSTPPRGLLWAQVFHFYQPPTQTHEVLARVVEEAYRPLLEVLSDFPGARVGIHITGVLTELLHDHGFGDVLGTLAELGERRQVEFLGGARFHPILPLLQPAERRRSIAENREVNARLIGPSWAPTGFFPPELAFSSIIVDDVAASDHRWLLLSGVASPDHWPMDHVPHTSAASGRALALLFRDDARSNRIAFKQTNPGDWVGELASLAPDGGSRYVVTAMDAETYGHHIAGWEREFLAATYGLLADENREPVHMVQPSEVVALFRAGPSIEPRSSSWSTSGDDIAAGNPLPLWKAPGNRLHALQWEYVDLVREMVAEAATAVTNPASQQMARLADETLQPGLHSCQFWWASRRPWWDPIMVERGLALLSRALLYGSRAIHLAMAPEPVLRATRWRLAVADDVRTQIERLLFAAEAP